MADSRDTARPAHLPDQAEGVRRKCHFVIISTRQVHGGYHNRRAIECQITYEMSCHTDVDIFGLDIGGAQWDRP